MKRFIAQTWAVIMLLLAWSFWVRHSGLNGIVIVTPIAVARELMHNPSFYVQPALHTIEVALFGMVGGLIFGLLACHRHVDVENPRRTRRLRWRFY